MSEFGGALVEEFIEGREFTVLVVDNPEDLARPLACMPLECKFGSGETFKHFDLKWHDYESISWVPCNGKDEELATRLRSASIAAYKATRGVSYARCDFRVSLDGDIYFLEINPNCGIMYPPGSHGSADEVLCADPDVDHARFLDLVIQAALVRHRSKKGVVEKRFQPDSGYGMYCTQRVLAGERVVQYENTEHVLASSQYVDRKFARGSLERQWFEEYAYPLSDGLWATWSADPKKWIPINHSCDPTCWVDGLDLLARRDLEPGEHLTMDYATFCVENTKPFDCRCGGRGRQTATVNGY